jgi:HPt (histidine-containing phosphotransfer) domain-containing protein
MMFLSKGKITMADELRLIDSEEGLKRVGGNLNLYKRLLQKFVDANYYAPLQEAIEAGDIEAAEQAAHTIKGVAANLALSRITAIATALDSDLKNAGDYAANFAALKPAIDDTLEAIAAL